jgi:hypothetical protein
LKVAPAFFFAFLLTTVSAPAQDLFELEVFGYEIAAPGDYGVELHTNVMSGGGVVPASGAGNHRPAHVSVEVARGWTERLETAVFIQTAPFGSSGSTRFAGGHVRGRARLGALGRVPLRFGLSAEYAFNRTAFDAELQTFEVRSILDYSQGRLVLIANPTVEIVMHGSEDGLDPVVDLSARAGWRMLDRVMLTADYFSAAADIRHLQPELNAHHLVFGGVDLDVGAGWGLTLAAGHCVTRDEPWVMKSVIRIGF